jgi:hypothetical protein
MGMTMPEIVSRAEAVLAGRMRYFTGKPCKRGHIDERRVAGCGCVTCDAEWRIANKEYLGDQRREYRRLNRERHNEHSRKSAARHPDKVRANVAKWTSKNPEKVKEIGMIRFWTVLPLGKPSCYPLLNRIETIWANVS